MYNKNGFTMMELLVTVLLIGILAAMAMPQYMKVVEKQKGTEAANILAVIGKSQERYFAVNEKYASDFSDLDADLIDFGTKTAAKGTSYNTKYFVFLLDGTEDKISKVKATRRGNESYILERNYTSGKLCCKNDNTADGDICDVLDLSDNTCDGTTEDPSNPPQPPVSTCSGTQPAASQACASGCGTQTRTVTCNNGTWTTGSWTGTCTSPTQTQPTSQACGTNGTQTRTCTPSCNGGTCGAWTTCLATTCSGTQPVATQACGNCNTGTQTRTVTCDTTNGSWVPGEWGQCSGGGVCSPGATRPCGASTTVNQVCGNNCTWNTCCDKSAAVCAQSGQVFQESNCSCVSCPPTNPAKPNVRSSDGTAAGCQASCKMSSGEWKTWSQTGYTNGQLRPFSDAGTWCQYNYTITAGTCQVIDPNIFYTYNYGRECTSTSCGCAYGCSRPNSGGYAGYTYPHLDEYCRYYYGGCSPFCNEPPSQGIDPGGPLAP